MCNGAWKIKKDGSDEYIKLRIFRMAIFPHRRAQILNNDFIIGEKKQH